MRHIQRLSRREKRPYRVATQRVDAHADHELHLRLLAQPCEACVRIDVEHAVLDSDLPSDTGDGGIQIALPVTIEQRTEIEIGEQVAVQQQKVVSHVVQHLRHRTARPERMVFRGVGDVHAKAGAASEECLDEMAQMIDRDHDVADSEIRKLAQQQLKDRCVSERHQGLGKHGRIGMEPRTLPARHHDCLMLRAHTT